MEKSTFGIIGAGGIANSQHLPNMLRSPWIDLRIVCDLDSERVRSACAEYGIAEGCTDHREVLANPERKVARPTAPGDFPRHIHPPLDLARLGIEMVTPDMVGSKIASIDESASAIRDDEMRVRRLLADRIGAGTLKIHE